ncbi:DNA topoisomerase 1 beta [Actinidia rufa]|uniref:DNA topoisomerase n=1 Tax=Actinidia rufa TaxID=165716 RepID=A0A7J0G9G2_9ERIC|nr:DNA topoisomerase 1 beta [Actinidia rufa]
MLSDIDVIDIHANWTMAVEACVNPKLMDDLDDDDDTPLVFKRSNTASKQNSLNSATKKSSSQRHDGQSGKQDSQVHLPNGQSSISQKSKPVSSVKGSLVKSPTSSPKVSTSSAKASAVKSPLASPKASTSSAKASPAMSSVLNSKTSTSAVNQSKHPSQHNATSAIKEERQLIKTVTESCSDSEDSEDKKPLSSRLSTSLSKVNTNHANIKPNTSSLGSPPMTKPRVKHEDSDDEVPLSSKFQAKSVSGPSTSKSSNFDEKKPIAPKIQQNGSTMNNNQIKKSSTVLNKRPLGDVNSSSQSSIKKPKLVDGSSPIGKQASVKAEPKVDDEDDDHIPISQRVKKAPTSGNRSSSAKKKVTKVVSSSFKKTNKKSKKVVKNSKYSKSSKLPPSSGEGQKWTTLVHNGVIFPPPYKPHGVKMLYKGKPVDLTPEQEEVATMFAVMLDTDYMNKPKFKENFINDWRKILGKNHVIQKLEDCDFTPIYEWHQKEKEKKKQMSTEEKKALKEEKLKQEEKYMWAIVDGVKEKVGNFRVEPPALFRGRGEHPKMGKLKKRIRPSDITINIGKDALIPECPIPGQRWKEIRQDNTVTWLAFWNDPINPKEFKYVFLAASSSLKGQSDKEKYEKARLLKDYIQGIRAAYTKDFASKDITKRQIAVATYLIDKLALRAGNEKDDDEADTVGCCTLKVENVEPMPPNILKICGYVHSRPPRGLEVERSLALPLKSFKGAMCNSGCEQGLNGMRRDLLRTCGLEAIVGGLSRQGATSPLEGPEQYYKGRIPETSSWVHYLYNYPEGSTWPLGEWMPCPIYQNEVEVELPVFKAIQHFRTGKSEGDDLFDKLDTSKLNAHLKELMPGLTAKVFRTYNASITLDEMLSRETKGGDVAEKVVVYQHANKEGTLDGLKTDLTRAKKGKPPLKSPDGKSKKNLNPEALERKIAQTSAKIEKMERDKETKEDLKTVALGTSKINYLDPRISVAWCKRHEVPIEKIFNKSLLAKFAWAMDVDPSFRF